MSGNRRARKGRGDMGFIEGRTRFGDGFGPATYFAMLAAVLVLSAALLLVFPARALAAADLSINKKARRAWSRGSNSTTS